MMHIIDLCNITLVVLFGLIIGSFLSVCIYRIPLGRKKGLESLDDPEDEIQYKPGEEDITILKPIRSFCPNCKKQLLWHHNIPLFSWLILRGKCAFCKTSIPAIYPVVEAITATTALACFVSIGQLEITPTAILVFAFISALIVISFIDIDYYIIPNVISIPGTILGLIIGLLNEHTHLFARPVVVSLTDSVIGIIAGGGVLYSIAAIYFIVRRQTGLGLGDVKLLMMTGAFFGYKSAFYTMFIGSVLGAILGILGMLLFRHKASRPMPFGPYLAIATVLYIFTNLAIPFWIRGKWEQLLMMVL